nr:uncharacterized protein LOC129381868 [Dermacentor andersoni]
MSAYVKQSKDGLAPRQNGGVEPTATSASDHGSEKPEPQPVAAHTAQLRLSVPERRRARLESEPAAAAAAMGVDRSSPDKAEDILRENFALLVQQHNQLQVKCGRLQALLAERESLKEQQQLVPKGPLAPIPMEKADSQNGELSPCVRDSQHLEIQKLQQELYRVFDEIMDGQEVAGNEHSPAFAPPLPPHEDCLIYSPLPPLDASFISGDSKPGSSYSAPADELPLMSASAEHSSLVHTMLQTAAGSQLLEGANGSTEGAARAINGSTVDVASHESARSPAVSHTNGFHADDGAFTFSGHGSTAVTMSPDVPLFMQVLCACLSLIAGGAAKPFDAGNIKLRYDAGQPRHFCAGGYFGQFADLTSIQGHRHVNGLFDSPSGGTMTSGRMPRRDQLYAIKACPSPTSFSGHGSTAVTMSPDVPLFMQVGDRKNGFRSDVLGLIVLPCPQAVVDCISDCFSIAALLLSLSGDVEKNPGPITEVMCREMLQNQKDILSKLTAVQDKQDSFETRILDMQSRILLIEMMMAHFRTFVTPLTALQHLTFSSTRHES